MAFKRNLRRQSRQSGLFFCCITGLGFALLTVAGCAAPRPPTSVPTTAPWSYRGYKGEEIRTQHWLIYSAATYPHWMDNVPHFTEAAYDHYQALVPAPATSRALTLYIFANGAQWEDYAEFLGVPPGDVVVAGKLTGFSLRDTAAVYVSAYPAHVFPAIAHVGMLEYLWLHDAGDAPLWIREGLATLAEGFNQQKDQSLLVPGQVVKTRYVFEPRYNATRINDLRAAMHKNWLYSIDQLLTVEDFSKAANPQVAARTYLAQIWATMVFMQQSRDYRKGFDRMRQDLASGELRQKVQAYLIAGNQALTPGQAAFRIYITQDLPTFQARFMTWARKYLDLAR